MLLTFCKLGLVPPYCRGYLEPPKLEGSSLVVQNMTSLKEYATSSFTQGGVQVQLTLQVRSTWLPRMAELWHGAQSSLVCSMSELGKYARK